MIVLMRSAPSISSAFSATSSILLTADSILSAGSICKRPVDVRVLLGVNLIDIHVLAFAVPVPDLASMQKSSVKPHLPQTLQQTLGGQRLSFAHWSLVPSFGFSVSGTVGPHCAFPTGPGKGGLPTT